MHLDSSDTSTVGLSENNFRIFRNNIIFSCYSIAKITHLSRAAHEIEFF